MAAGGVHRPVCGRQRADRVGHLHVPQLARAAQRRQDDVRLHPRPARVPHLQVAPAQPSIAIDDRLQLHVSIIGKKKKKKIMH